ARTLERRLRAAPTHLGTPAQRRAPRRHQPHEQDEAVSPRGVEADHRLFHRRLPFSQARESEGSRGALDELDGDDALRLGALRPVDRVELHLRTLGERLEAIAGDRGMVDEYILATISRGDEPIPLRIVEPFHGSGCHTNTSSTTKERAEEAHTAQPVLAQESPPTVARRGPADREPTSATNGRRRGHGNVWALPPRFLIEFPADEPERARQFWQGVLGTSLRDRRDGEGRGWQGEHAAVDIGLHERGAGPGDRFSLPYFTVADLAAAVERVQALGGEIVH